MSGRAKAYAVQAVVYAAALAAAYATVVYAPIADPLWRAAVADVVATFVVFGFSVATSNSSMYDPYWSVAPPALFAFWATTGEVSVRAMIVFGLVSFWAARLTLNFLRGFDDVAREDWRYVDLRAEHGPRYWMVSFLGIHFFPTVLTFAGSVSLFVVLGEDTAPLGPLDAVALGVTALGIAYEAIADEQLRRYVRGRPPKGEWLRAGLWRHTRHPNYFGECTFWWGLGLFAIAAAPTAWWTFSGAIGITLLFFFVSIPLIDRRMVARRPRYAEYAKRVSRLVPWPIRPQ